MVITDNLMCEKKFCDPLVLVLSVGQLLANGKNTPAYASIFKDNLSKPIRLPIDRGTFDLGSEISSMQQLWNTLTSDTILTFHGPQKKITQHFVVADKDHVFDKNYHSSLVTAMKQTIDETEVQNFKHAEINPWTHDFVSAMSEITRTCQQTPDLSLTHTGGGSIVYDFFKYKNDISWAEPGLDQMGLNTEKYTQQTLWALKMRSFGMRVAFRVNKLSPTAGTDSDLLVQYIVRAPKASSDDYSTIYDHSKWDEDRPETITVAVNDKNIFVKLHCVTYTIDVAALTDEVHDLMVVYGIHPDHTKDNSFVYEKGEKAVYYNGAKINPDTDLVSCPKLPEKACNGKKCHERRFVVGHDDNGGEFTFDKLEVFRPEISTKSTSTLYRGITDLLQYTQKHSCPLRLADAEEDAKTDGKTLYKCTGELNR